MKPILKVKIAVDAAMTLAMLLLMAYSLVGEAAHEWIGMGMLVLVGNGLGNGLKRIARKSSK